MRFLPMLGAVPSRDVDEGEGWVASAAVLVQMGFDEAGACRFAKEVGRILPAAEELVLLFGGDDEDVDEVGAIRLSCDR